MIRKGASGAAAPLSFTLSNTSTGAFVTDKGTTGPAWNVASAGLTDELKVRLPGGAYGNATISRIVNLGGGLYHYELTAGETATEGRVYFYPNVAIYDGGLSTARTDDIVDTAGASAVLHGGTAQAGAANSITLAAGALATNGSYVNGIVVITGGTGAGQQNQITGYVGATRVAAVADAWTTNPDNTSVYAIYPGSSPRAHALMLLNGINVEGSSKLADLVRGIFAMVAGKADDFDDDTAHYYAMDGVTVRVTVTYDDTGRPNVVINSLAA